MVQIQTNVPDDVNLQLEIASAKLGIKNKAKAVSVLLKWVLFQAPDKYDEMVNSCSELIKSSRMGTNNGK